MLQARAAPRGRGWRRLTRALALALLLAALSLTAICARSAARAPGPIGLRGALLTARGATAERLASLKGEGYNAIALDVRSADPEAVQDDAAAAERIRGAGLDLYFWLEIAHCAELADEHPAWMASLQGHAEWRRLHKGFALPASDEVVKSYPWVPVLYEEAFDAHLARVEKLLADRPSPKGVFLNDLQGAPSACGCGNPVCRWTADYGPIVTATRLGDDAAARFVVAVQQLVAVDTGVIPVWTTECEAHDQARDALCAGVNCFKGICWKAYARQLTPLADQAPVVGALLLYKEFGQDRPIYREPAGWIKHAIGGFSTMPAKSGGKPVEARRLIAILQGHDVEPTEVAEQIARVRESGAAGYVVALNPIDQSWSPRIVKWKAE